VNRKRRLLGIFDQAHIVVLDAADARADRPRDHAVGRVGGQQRLQLCLVRRDASDPNGMGQFGVFEVGLRGSKFAQRRYGPLGIGASARAAAMAGMARRGTGRRCVSRGPASAGDCGLVCQRSDDYQVKPASS